MNWATALVANKTPVIASTPRTKFADFETPPIEGSDHGVLCQKGETSPFATFVPENGAEFKDRISRETFEFFKVAVFAQEATTPNEIM